MDDATREEVEAALAGAVAHLENVAVILANEWNHKDGTAAGQATYQASEAALQTVQNLSAQVEGVMSGDIS